MIETLAVFLPLIGSVVSGIIIFINSENESMKKRTDLFAQITSCFCMVVSAIFSILIFQDVALMGNNLEIFLFKWIDSGRFEVSWALKIDTLSAIMILLVTTVSSMVHIYSIGYMSHDRSIPRFMSFLSLFTFFMLMLVTSDNLIQLFFGWEGVGLASYLLIGFWYEKPSANAAAVKAFLINRVGDFGFALGILGIFLVFESIHFETLFLLAPNYKDLEISVFGGEFHALTVCSLLLFLGAMGKSAQIGLHTWLPDAMEGPTPVSALIHAATMVTAGIFLVARMSPIIEYSDVALTTITLIGSATAIFAATIACVQTDIKRVIAYSTCSQLGYMFFACGVSAYSAGIFHLMTHGFFKALLFLGAGSVIHAMSDQQDMRKMGGIWKIIPVTYVLMWIGSLALSGIPPFAGYFSKDIILESAFASGSHIGRSAYWIGIVTAFLTAFYSWRLLFMTFHGTTRADEITIAHIHESPKVMTLPLLFLAFGACFSGYLGFEYFVGHNASNFWGSSILVLDHHNSLNAAHEIDYLYKKMPLIAAIFGILGALVFYIQLPNIPDILSKRFNRTYQFLLQKWYFDELYNRLFVRPTFYIAKQLWKIGDGVLIDGLGPDGISSAVQDISRRISHLQSGYVYHYAFAMLIGLVGIVTWYLYSFSG